MNCVANILHKICNASVFFSAYRTCYNSIVKIEQKRKSAFFRGRSFCLEVVEISREERDVYLIPQNFVDTGTILGGTVKLRNAVEAAVLAVGSAVPLFYLPLAFNIRLMIVIAVSVPLGVFGVVGIGGDSLTQFVAHWFRFMKRRRIVTPTPQGNLEANRHRHLWFISKRYRVIYYDDADTLPHNAQVLQRKADRHGKLVKRQTLYDLLPIEKIENGILHTTDDRYIKILEIEPINFLLRSPREQRSVIYSFASLLKVSPVRLQFKSFSRKADVNAYLDKLRRDAANEPDAAVRKRHMSYIRFVKRLGSRDAVSRRFFVIFQYEAPTNERNISYAEIVSTLETTARNFRTYLAQCGNAIVEHENEDEFLTDVFYTLLNRRTAVQISLQERIQDVLASYLAQNDATALDKIPPAAFMIPPSLDLKHGRYLCIDGTYHAYLMIPADGYRAQVTAGWMALLVNAGEGIDVDLFLERQPKERMMQKIGQQIRINRSKIKDTSDTNSDFDDLSNAIRSGYYLKDGLANNEDFYYAAILVTVTAASVKDLEWRIGEIRKLMVSQDMNLQLCSFRQEAAFLSSLLLCSPDAALFKKYRRNILTSTAASFYPFVSFELCDTNGVLLGVNKYNNSLVSLAEWVTDGTPHYMERIPMGTYTLTETVAPIEQGYVRAESVTFEVGPTENIQRVEMKDDFTKVEIFKADMTDGHELPGAKLKITDASGNTIAEWETNGQPHRIERLKPGDYTLTETAAPAGYLLSEEVHFTVQETGEIQKVTMYDAPAHSLILTKRDIATNAKLADARLTIRDAYGTTIDRWTTTDGDHAIRVLPERSAAKDPHKNLLLLSDDTSEHVYTMVEELAPNGYLVAESITFKVMQMNDTLVVFVWQDGGWQKSSEGYLAMYDERTDTPVPLMKTFPQTGNIL